MATEGRFDRQILRVSREEFSKHGYYGTRIDTVALNAKVNKRMIYEFCHTKEGLYMITLSDVSREAMDVFKQSLPQLRTAEDVRTLYSILFNLLEDQSEFIRLWAWERMDPTIHGPRILETASSIFEQVRQIVSARFLKSFPESCGALFEAVEALCHGYLLTSAMYFRCDPETDTAEISGTQSPALRRLNMSMNTQGILLESIERLLVRSV
ncbi:MAG: TetR/AcrR family transcriptional regulator [Proteobacteria bacterium]|nr:TetR/AcrR family transcriptional regulator [Pseudomonadota bacterium]